MVISISENVNAAAEDKGLVLKRFVLSFIVSLPFFTHGIASTNLSTSDHSGHFTTPYNVPWTSFALILSSILSASLQGYFIDKWGRKFGIYLVILLQGASCIPLFLTHTEVGFIVLHVLSGISTAGLFLSIPIYIREINSNVHRGVMTSFIIFMTSAGYLVKFGLTGENILYLIAALVIVQFISLFMVVESPSYLVKVGKIEIAKSNMGKLKCLPVNDPHIEHEIKLLEEESKRAKPNGEFRFFDIVRNVLWRDEIKIGLMLSTINTLCGWIIFLDQDKTLIQLKTDVDPQNFLVPVCMFVGACVCFLSIRIVERKYLLTFAYSVMVLSMGTLAVFTQADLTVPSYTWLPVTALSILIFGYGIAWGLPTVIMVEILNLEVRSTILSVIFTYSQVLRLAHVMTFQYIEEYVGIYTLLYIFACINMFGAVYTISNVPDIKDSEDDDMPLSTDARDVDYRSKLDSNLSTPEVSGYS
ncbi:unnamed protein product, partial [Brenthis ino]